MKDKKEIEMLFRRDGMSGVMVKRIMRLMDQFATPEGFFSASKTASMKEYSKIAPGKEYGLGDKFWVVLNRATELYRGVDLSKSEQNEDKSVENESENEKYKEEVMKMLSLEDLKTVVAFMELCDVEAINILEIVGFLGAVRLRQKKPVSPPVQDADRKDGFALEA